MIKVLPRFRHIINSFLLLLPFLALLYFVLIECQPFLIFLSKLQSMALGRFLKFILGRLGWKANLLFLFQRGELSFFMNRSSSANKGKEALAEPVDLELRLGPPGETANPSPISDPALGALESFQKEQNEKGSKETFTMTPSVAVSFRPLYKI